MLRHRSRIVKILVDERKKLVRSIITEKQKLADLYRELYKPVQDFIGNHRLANGKIFLQFDVVMNLFNFETEFFNWINHSTGGSFYGKEWGIKKLSSTISKFDLNSADEIIDFLDEIIDELQFDSRNNPPQKNEISDQLRKGKELVQFYNFLFSAAYLRPRFILKLGNKEINQLSPGEKGALLLIFYLLVDKDDKPLLIDQPEHNLDNQTVFDLLVPCIKEAKINRQIIMVTHNPNLAVVCDADQIICCSIDKQNLNKVSYVSGAIENLEINRKIIDILEGTPPAFNNRGNKYHSLNHL